MTCRGRLDASGRVGTGERGLSGKSSLHRALAREVPSTGTELRGIEGC